MCNVLHYLDEMYTTSNLIAKFLIKSEVISISNTFWRDIPGDNKKPLNVKNLLH
jgi:hypothetical protein